MHCLLCNLMLNEKSLLSLVYHVPGKNPTMYVWVPPISIEFSLWHKFLKFPLTTEETLIEEVEGQVLNTTMAMKQEKKIKNRLYMQVNLRWWDNSHQKVDKMYVLSFTHLEVLQAPEKSATLKNVWMTSIARVMCDITLTLLPLRTSVMCDAKA